MLKDSIISITSKEKFYRKLLLIIAGFYLIYHFVYIFVEFKDPMSFSLRFLTILLYLSVYILSYKVEWIKNKIEKISYLILTISVLHLLYYNHIFDFKLRTSILVLISVLILNLVFKADKFSFAMNLLIGSLTGLSLWITKTEIVFSVFFYSSYILISFLSFYIKYYLQQNEMILENLADQAPGTLYQYQLFPDGRSRFSYVSKGIYEIFEVTSEEVVENAEKLFNKINPKDYEQVVNSIQQSAQNLNLWHNEYRVNLPKQGEKWVEGWAKPEKLKDGSILWHGNIRDVTAEKKLKLKLKEQKTKFKWIIEGTNAGTWEWNIQTGKTIFNEKWAEMLGYKLEDIEPTSIETWEKYTHPEDLKRAEKNAEMHFKGELDQYDVEIRMKHKNGDWIWINDRGRVVSWTKNNKPLKMSGIHLDITKRKKQQEELKYEHRFQKKLAEISSDLLEVDLTNIDRKINKALKNIGDFFGIDRIYIFVFSDNYKQMTNRYRWCAKDIESQKGVFQDFTSDSFRWWMEKLSKNEVIIIPDVNKMEIKAGAVKEMLAEQNLKSAISIPIFIESKLFGFFVFDIGENNNKFTDQDINKLNIISGNIIKAFSDFLNDKKVENLNKQLNNEINKAKKLHENTLPMNMPEINKLDIHAYYRPANEIGGDFYNLIKLSDNKLLFYLSDVTGHGLDAAMMSAFVKSTINSYLELHSSDEIPNPKEIIEFIFKQNQKENFPEEYFITILIGIIDTAANEMIYSSAGMHINPIICNNYLKELPAGNLPISKIIPFEIVKYQNKEIKLPRGTAIFVTTDGIFEQPNNNGEEYGDRYKNIICKNKYSTAKSIAEEINNDFTNFYNEQTKDDITYVIFKLN